MRCVGAGCISDVCTSAIRAPTAVGVASGSTPSSSEAEASEAFVWVPVAVAEGGLVIDTKPDEDEAEAVADARLAESDIPVNSLSENIDVSDMVTETGGAVVTTSLSGGWSEPSTSSGLKMLMEPLQAEASCSSRENTRRYL